MWPLIKSYVIGNPLVIAGMLAGFVIWSGICGGYGYYKAVGQYEAAQFANQQALVAAQHEVDVQEHNRAIAEGKIALARRESGKVRIVTIEKEIAALPTFVSEACAPNDDVVRLLNEAGK